jgi:hypothetical protein
MRKFWSAGLLAVSALALGLAVNAGAQEKAKAKPSQLDMLKKLAGEWTGKGSHGEHQVDATVTYKVTGGDSAVVETHFPGTEHEMITVYTLDGDDLVLTHYCMLGNQPRMKAERGGDGKKLAFKFTGAGNLKSEKDQHMHDVTIEFVDDDHIKSTWTLYQDGKPVEKATFDLKRKKK